MVLGCLLDWPAVRPCRLAVCRTSTINRWTSRLRPEGHTCSFGGSRPVRSATCTCAASPTGTKRLRTVESPRWCFSFGGRRAARIPVLATVRRDRRPRPSAVPRVRRRESLGAITHPRALWAAVRGRRRCCIATIRNGRASDSVTAQRIWDCPPTFSWMPMELSPLCTMGVMPTTNGRWISSSTSTARLR